MPNTPPVDELTLLTSECLDSAAATLASAFAYDPLWQIIYSDERKRQRVLAQFFEAVLAQSIGRQRAYGVGAPFNGVAVWEFPGQPQGSLPVTAAWRFARLAVGPFAFAAFKVRGVFTQFERMRKTYAPEQHFYLQTIGIRPAAQGQGMASRLIRPFLAQADRRGLGVYTETVTPANVALYEHFDFQVMEICRVPGLPLTLWGFYRAAMEK